MRIHTIYIIKNRRTGKQYVGVTHDLKQRMYDHKHARPDLLDGGYDVTAVASARGKQNGGWAEACIIAQEDTLVPNGYNVLPGGFLGRNMPQSVRDKIGKLASERPSVWVGRKHRPESKAKMSATKRARFAAGLISPTWKGKTMSAETRAKVSASKIGRSAGRPGKRTPEEVARMVAGRKAARERRGPDKKPPPHSPETKEKIRQSVLAYYGR